MAGRNVVGLAGWSVDWIGAGCWLRLVNDQRTDHVVGRRDCSSVFNDARFLGQPFNWIGKWNTCLRADDCDLVATHQQTAVSQLLRGELEGSTIDGKPKSSGWIRRSIAWVMVVAALGLAAFATQLAGEPQAGAFMGAGFLLLAAGLTFVYSWLSKDENQNSAVQLSLSRMALLSAKRNPLRSTLTIGLVAVASFLIAAVSAFRSDAERSRYVGF